ncbi:MAG: hypothetical protein DI551_01070 [Micavibrio aeruginosavorus]|uniref:Bbp19-like phage domain-containing protein n=1 Tax=Micavibrio aeruginosavorus TaxID=349221 RepID=A0A2W5PVD7_9BACT|nr:MAG: hypothetical protein DI551_01070 [Micavibrio aeruginosavorus]
MEDNAVFISHVSRLEQKEIERSFARVFASEEGKKVLAWLQVMTFQRASGSSSTDEQLRYMEGQRSLVASILRMIDRGRNN